MKQLLFLFLLVMLIFSCKREEPITEHIYHYLDAKYLAISPYFNNPEIDTLEFISNLGDTQVFVKTHIDTTWYDVNSSKADGPTYLSHYEQRRANFKCIKGDGYLRVLLAAGYPKNLNIFVVSWGNSDCFYALYFWTRKEDPDYAHTNFKEFLWQNKVYKDGFKLIDIYDDVPLIYHSDKEGIFLIQDSIKNINYTLNN
jgi:hypothetical protein